MGVGLKKAEYLIPGIVFSLLIVSLVVFDSLSGISYFTQLGFDIHGDQGAILKSVSEVIGGRPSPEIAAGWMGVGFAAYIVFFHRIVSFFANPTLTSSLVWSGVVAFCAAATLAFAGTYFFSLKLALQRNLKRTSKVNFLPWKMAGLSFTFLVLVFKLSVASRFSYIPWAHYLASFVVITLVITTLLLFHSDEYKLKPKLIRVLFIVLGFAALFISQLRMHEFLTYLVALSVYVPFWLYKTKQRVNLDKSAITNGLPHLGWILFGAALAATFIGILVPGHNLNLHYFTLKKGSPWLAEYLRLYPRLTVYKLIQTFIDPDFYSYGQSVPFRTITGEFTTEWWRLPLIGQMPILFYFIPAAVFLAVFHFRNKKFCFEASALLFPVLIVVIQTGGYASSAVWGSEHLKNGLIREFMSSMFLLLFATAPYQWIHLFSKTADSSFWKKVILVSIGMPIVLGAGIGQRILLKTGLPEIRATHLDRVLITSNCKKLDCNFTLKFMNLSGTAISMPSDKVILHGVCKSDGSDFSVTLQGPQYRFTAIPCPENYAVEVFPIAMGSVAAPVAPAKVNVCSSGKKSG